MLDIESLGISRDRVAIQNSDPWTLSLRHPGGG